RGTAYGGTRGNVRRARSHLRPGPTKRQSDAANVLGLRTLGALGEVELDLLVVLEGLEALRLDRGEVDEDVLAAAVLRDEAEALVSVEPLDGSLSHVLFLWSVAGALRPRAAEDIHLCCWMLERTENQENRRHEP